MEDCIFCKIIAGEIPAKKKYEDHEIVVFEDIEPKAKIHLLCVPKEHFAYLSDMDGVRSALIGRNLQKVAKLAPVFGLKDGYRVIINQGDNAGQTVKHLHIHLLGGEQLPF
ncbi:MAG: histidine triad nucleotide-binding protein [Clostridia bacterium]|nr:histidine triad nucleotide-binding protein [Clostridia bacterium]